MSAQDSNVITGNLQRIDSPSKFSVYCNASEILVNGWDVRINLMENVPPTEGKSGVVVHGSVVMSPIHAKALFQALGKAIDQYEERFGDLDVKKVLDAQNALLMSPTV